MEIDDTNESKITREDVLLLIQERSNIENQISQWKEILDGNKTDMKESLVDSDGYPRADIDVYQVRLARNKISMLMNDHKALTKKIEVGLHEIHAQNRDQVEVLEQVSSSRLDPLVPFARLDHVTKSSPADIAGLQEGDLIVRFGSVDHSNFKSLQDIGYVVKNSVGQKISVKVLRNKIVMRMELIPTQWAGSGLLGCNIVIHESIDR